MVGLMNLWKGGHHLASVNDSKFLVDSTGNRRFLVFEVEEIDFKHIVDMDMVYSQCLHLYKNGFKPYLNPKETQRVNKVNESYLIRSYEEELLLKYFQPCRKGEGEILTTTEINYRIGEEVKIFVNNTSIILLGKALSKNKFVKGRNKHRAHGWWVQTRGVRKRKRTKDD